jgi:acyl carrier protein
MESQIACLFIMSSTHTKSGANREGFAESLLQFINKELPKLDRRGRAWKAVEADTSLFENGRLDSLSILHLIARVEELTGCPVPDQLVVMKHFRSVEAMTSAFCKATTP